MAHQICLFEDDHVSQLLPLVFFRTVYELRCGIFTLCEKILHAYPRADVSFHCRSSLVPTLKSRYPHIPVNEIQAAACLFINGRLVADPALAKKIPLTAKRDIVYVSNGQLVAAYVSGKNLEQIKNSLTSQWPLAVLEGIPTVEIEAELVKYPWDLVQKNGVQITQDFESMMRKVGKGRSHIEGKIYSGVHVTGKKNLFIERGARIKPGTVLDAENGPIYIGKDVNIFPQSTIIGPVCILQGTAIKVGAQIYENTTIGPVCKVGGEVEESIIHAYSNKQHAGFLGHSYLGSWVNLGAGTTTSDLKNNYSNVKVQVGIEQVNTGLTFVGLTMGDHSKCAIGTTFNTGTVVGVCSNIFGSGFPPKFVPSFTWGGMQKPFAVYEVEKAIGVARTVMARRKIDMSNAEADLIRRVFQDTTEDRRRSSMQV
jgi:UDP-N-acetylglucosamine diphosphorylase/glucosamine-1-phosphate N-acetyltransferase